MPSGGGLFGDAEALKFVPGKESIDKIQQRIVMLSRASDLDVPTRAKLACIIYSIPKENLQQAIEKYMQSVPNGPAFPLSKKFEIWWAGLIKGEKRDLMKMAGMRKL